MKQPGELIQKLMQNSSILPSTVVSSSVASETSTNTNDLVSISSQTLHESHEFCLEDLLKDDSYEKLMKNERPHLVDNVFDNSSVMSYNNNMTTATMLSSCYDVASLGHNNNYSMSFPSTLETINEDSIKELLGALR